jgi:hypothetical protein
MSTYHINKIKLAILLFPLLAFVPFSYSQSKKEQIELLKLKYDSLIVVTESERAMFLKERETLTLNIQRINSEKETCFKKTEELNEEIKLTKRELELINKKIIQLYDSISKSKKFNIVSFSISEIEILGAGPGYENFVKEIDYAVLQITDNAIKGYVGWASQGDGEYFISGDLVNGSFIGDVFNISCSGDCNSFQGKFQLKIDNLKLKVSGDAHLNNDEIPVYNGLHFFQGALTNLINEPLMGSKVLLSSIINSENEISAEILEIGNYEKLNGEYNLWYKVKINNVTGWIFGGLCTFCQSSDE